MSRASPGGRIWIKGAVLSAALALPLALPLEGQELQPACSPLEAEALRVAGLRDSNAAAGLVAADSLAGRARDAGCPKAESMALAARGDNLLTLGRYAEARNLFEGLTKTLTAEGPSVLLSSVLRRAGAAFYYMGELDHALERYRRSAAVAEQAGDVIEAAKAMSNIGALYLQIGRLDEALAIYERAAKSFSAQEWPAGTAGFAINVGQVHAALADRAQEAGDTTEFRRQQLEMYRANEQAYAQFATLGNRRGIATAVGNLGVAASGLGRHDEALRWQRQALSLHREIGDVQGQVSALGTMSGTLIALGRLDEAERNLRRAEPLLDSMPASERQRIARFWVDLYEARGDHARALERMHALLRLNAEVERVNYGTRVAEIEARARNERMAQQIGQMTTEQTIADLRFTRLSLVLAVALMAVALLAVLFVMLVRSARATQRAGTELERAARTDQLTGLANRRGIYERIEQERGRWHRSGEPFSLALMDLDDFKAINDSYGHEIGDAVLLELGRRIATQIRTQDTAGRWGGEEFLLLLPNTTAAGAAVLAQKVCDGVATIPIPVSRGQLRVSLTIGLCQYGDDLTINECIRLADEAMYSGKRAGKNRVVVATPGFPANA